MWTSLSLRSSLAAQLLQTPRLTSGSRVCANFHARSGPQQPARRRATVPASGRGPAAAVGGLHVVHGHTDRGARDRRPCGPPTRPSARIPCPRITHPAVASRAHHERLLAMHRATATAEGGLPSPATVSAPSASAPKGRDRRLHRTPLSQRRPSVRARGIRVWRTGGPIQRTRPRSFDLRADARGLGFPARFETRPVPLGRPEGAGPR